MVRPVLDSRQGLVVACGMNPCYGDLDTYWMAASAIDEAVRNCVAVGADPDTNRHPGQLLLGNHRPARDARLAGPRGAGLLRRGHVLGTPFISGKDSLNNEFSYTDAAGERRTIAIPASLLVSAMGLVEDVSRCVTDGSQGIRQLPLSGRSHARRVGGSHFTLVEGTAGGQVPRVEAAAAKQTFAAMHRAITAGAGAGMSRSERRRAGRGGCRDGLCRRRRGAGLLGPGADQSDAQ